MRLKFNVLIIGNEHDLALAVISVSHLDLILKSLFLLPILDTGTRSTLKNLKEFLVELINKIQKR